MSATRLLKTTAVALLTVLAALFLVAPASAAPAPAAAPAAEQYTNPGDFTVSLSLSVVVQGGQVRVFITGSINGRVFSIRVFSQALDLGTVTADLNGDASLDFSSASLDAGPHTVEVTAVDTGEVRTVPFTVIVPSSGGSAAVSGGGSAASGGLAFTGSNAIVPLGTIGVILVGAGAAAVVAARRRRADGSSAI